MLVTIDFLAFRHLRDALRASRSPLHDAAPPPAFVKSLFVGSGPSLHAPWPRHRTSLATTLVRRDGWGPPDLRRLALLAAWHENAPKVPLRFPMVERWHGVFDPVHIDGTIDGRQPVTARAQTPSTAQPGAILTYARGNRHPVRFLRHTNQVVEHLHRHDGVSMAAGLTRPGGPSTVVFSTLSCWTDLGQALEFAYRACAPHAEAIQLARAGHYGSELFFARLALVSSEGTVAGRDPFDTAVRAVA